MDVQGGPVTRRLAAFLSQLSYQQLPPQAVALLKCLLLDVLGTSLAASRLGPGCREASELALREGAIPQSSIIGLGAKVSAPMAAFANGALAHALNYDDWGEGGIHAGATTVPAALAVAEQVGGVGGQRFLAALAAGVELECRLAAALARTGSQGRWVLGQLIGYFGAAVSAGAVLELRAEQMHSALGLALAQAAGTMQMVLEGDPPAKSIYAAFPNQAGVLSAWLAKKGLRADCAVFEGQQGLFNAYFGRPGPLTDLEEGLGQRFYLTNVRFKPWPVSGIVQPFLEAALEVRGRHSLAPGGIARVLVRGGEHIRPWCEPLAERRRPQNAAGASDSIPFAVAKALVNGDFTLADLTEAGLQQAEALELAQRIEYAIEGPLGDVAVLEVVTDQGSRYSARIGTPLGHPSRPLSFGQLAEKFQRCARHAARPLPEERAAAVVQLVQGLELVDDVARLAGLLNGH